MHKLITADLLVAVAIVTPAIRRLARGDSSAKQGGQ